MSGDGEPQPETATLVYHNSLFETTEELPGELLPALRDLDPGLIDHPVLDRQLFALLRGADSDDLLPPPEHRRELVPVRDAFSPNDAQDLARLRRRLYFEGSAAVFGQAGLDPAAMLGYPAFGEFLGLVSGDGGEADALRRICRALSLADRVPPAYVDDHPGMALRSGRNATTSTVLFRHYPMTRFVLELASAGYDRPYHEWLPGFLLVTHQGSAGKDIRLRVHLDLYQYLWELSEGYAPGAPEFEAAFANLDVFRDRLLLLPANELVATHPIHGSFRIMSGQDNAPSLELRRI